jgi:hypothetical protein
MLDGLVGGSLRASRAWHSSVVIAINQVSVLIIFEHLDQAYLVGESPTAVYSWLLAEPMLYV